MKTAASIIALCVTLPIWFFLLYRILVRTGAGELDFFLLWVYIPASITASILVGLSTTIRSNK